MGWHLGCACRYGRDFPKVCYSSDVSVCLCSSPPPVPFDASHFSGSLLLFIKYITGQTWSGACFPMFPSSQRPSLIPTVEDAMAKPRPCNGRIERRCSADIWSSRWLVMADNKDKLLHPATYAESRWFSNNATQNLTMRHGIHLCRWRPL